MKSTSRVVLSSEYAERRIEHARARHRPELPGEQDERRTRAEADREQEQCDGNAEGAMDATGEANLNEEASEREVDRDLREQFRDGIAVGAGGLGRHTELLVYDGGADGGEGNHPGQHPQMPRLRQEPEGLASTNTALIELLGLVLSVRQAHDLQDEDDADGQRDRADEKKVVRADRLDSRRGDCGAHRSTQAGAATDQTKESLRLPGVVDVVGQSPELAEEQDAEDLSEEIQRHRDPHRAGAKERPEEHEQSDEDRLRDRNHILAWDSASRTRVEVHQHADEDGGGEQDVRKIVGAELIDELRLGDRLQNVVRGHRQKRVSEHEEGNGSLTASGVGQTGDDPIPDGIHEARYPDSLPLQGNALRVRILPIGKPIDPGVGFTPARRTAVSGGDSLRSPSGAHRRSACGRERTRGPTPVASR